MSFFDEVDEPRPEPPTAESQYTPARGGRRPPTDQQAIRVRRAVALVALVIILILIVVGVHSCQVSQRNSSMKNYSNAVASLNQQSDQTSKSLFQLLSSGGTGNPTNLQSQIDESRITADSQLQRARSLDVPDEMKPAQQNFVLALQMRRDGITSIATNIQPALGATTSTDAVNAIAAQMARFYASDVAYKDYTLPLIASALHSAGIAVGGSNGEQFNAGQFLPDLQWLAPSFIASQLHASAPSSNAKPAPGVHGHKMDSCSVGGTALDTGSTNTIAASPPPTFTCKFTNDGQNNETNVVVKVSVSGTSIGGQTTVPQTTPGQQSTAQVTLNSSPSPGTATVTATVEKVPGETTTTHNTLSFPVNFH